eukprot:CAMPEP_0197607346 /NCGR_PEP_ID=MMETSP1326-20131121/46879_1 /TAXON_ID=1155430 /ORGANISM="Genus nov. species nov., Strain RCC2288" /LENGTH=41 /DNA_ID= /DNA_START= /DNA_END= /DNA_ORIENTATION=
MSGDGGGGGVEGEAPRLPPSADAMEASGGAMRVLGPGELGR